MPKITNLYATFGSGQPFSDHIIHFIFAEEIKNPKAEAHKFMQHNFNNRYCAIYDEERWTKPDNRCSHYKTLLTVETSPYGDQYITQDFNGGRLA